MTHPFFDKPIFKNLAIWFAPISAMALVALISRPVAASHGSSQDSSVGYILVENERAELVQVFVDTRYKGTVPADAERRFRVPSGSRDLKIRKVDGQVVDSETVRVRNSRTTVFEVDEPMGRVQVRNPLPISVEITTPQGIKTIAPQRSAYFHAPIGRLRITVQRLTDEKIGTLTANIREDRSVALTVPEPKKGILELDNLTGVTAKVYVDGKRLVQVSGNREKRLELSLGRHSVLVVDVQGTVLFDRRVTVEPFDSVQVMLTRQDSRLSSNHVRPEDALTSGLETYVYSGHERPEESSGSCHLH